MINCVAKKGEDFVPGKATRPDDGRHHNRGGNRGGGRPKGSTSPRGQRGVHQIRAYDDEWQLIRAFQQLTRVDPDQCRLAVNRLCTALKKEEWLVAELPKE